MMSNLSDFLEYLNEQIGEPYLWGGQHTKLTTENYVEVIDKKEANTGGYSDMTYAEAAKAYCFDAFASGKEVLYAYDCSGLGVYWLYNLKKLYKGDCNANTMMKRCELSTETPKAGWWCFRTDSTGKANHIGYLVTDTEVVEAKGRKYGVTKSKFLKTDWSCWGIPAVFKDDFEPEPEPEPQPTELGRVKVKGNSVNIRDCGSTDGRVLHIAHKGEVYDRYGDNAPSGWYGILCRGQQGYISNKEKYTELIE